MGQGKSTGGQVLSQGQPTAQVPAEPPYPGPRPEYRFLITQVTHRGNYTLGFSQGQEAITSNIDAYYPLLSSQYNEGFRLISFYKTPELSRPAFSQSMTIPYQGIFCRYPQPDEGYRLQIEKSIVDSRVNYNGLFVSAGSGVVADTSHLIQSVINHSQQGGRLICVEATGQVITAGFSRGLAGQAPTVGVDLFFNMPMYPNPEMYCYNVLSVPIQIHAGFNSNTVHCDWATHLGQFLSQGWRLVEIFLDSGITAGKAFSRTAHLNSIWFFEKPLSKTNDMTPMYQGTYIEHYVKIRGTFTGTKAECGWEPVIQEMAQKGWELACILETPEYKVTGFQVAKMKFILFFQRRIIA